ncbi:MAG: choice-of-anchor D domain-containing protein [Planctomycetes bacterium]|nr:choice-of-anchor D domain-containing protein [Planctomycetota bacterium]
MMHRLGLILIVLAAGACAAEDYGDAPASYGLARVYDPSYSYLGLGASDDLQNPVTPAWTGDDDDAIVGTPSWDSWSSQNSLTVYLGAEQAHLMMWVDADDSGQFDANELYAIMPGYELEGGHAYTFENIRIHATQDFSRNGHNKVAVRIFAQSQIGGPPQHQPTAWSYFGEVEDWLIDVEPAKFVIQNETLSEATETDTYNTPIQTVNGTGGINWTMTGGSLPPGTTLTQQGNDFVLSGTPIIGSAGDYTIVLRATDGASHVTTRSLTLHVTPRPFALPFLETFSTNNHWRLDSDFAIMQATGYVSPFVTALNLPHSEPAHDFTPATTDDMVLLSTPGGREPEVRLKPIFATSPKIDCTNASQVEVRFRRWYSVFFPGYRNPVKLELTSDGVTWDTIWQPPYSNGNVCDVAWSLITVDVTQHAANKPWIRLRFRIGEHTVVQAGSSTGGFQEFLGWGIDDIEVGAPKLSTPLVAHNMEITSPTQFQNPDNQVWYPLLYPQYEHAFEVRVDNPTAHDVTINSMEGASFVELLPGTSQGNIFVVPAYYMAADCQLAWGSWTLDQPVTIPAHTPDVPVTGKFRFNGSPAQFWTTPVRARAYLRGTQATTNAEVELYADDYYTPNADPIEGLYVYENQVGGTYVSNGATVANSRNFGNRSVGTNSSPLYIIVENTTGNPITVNSPTLTGPDAGEFFLNSASLTNPLAANDWTYFTIRFIPTSTGAKAATVEFTHSATNTNPPFTFDVSGYGAGNEAVVSVREGGPAGLMISSGAQATGQREFGPIDVRGNPSATRTIHIENAGLQPLQLGAPYLDGTHLGEFGLDTAGMATSLPPGATTTFDYWFDPSSAGNKSATIKFTHNDLGTGTSNPFRIPVTGVGVYTTPRIVVSDTGVNGAGIQPGTAAAQGRLFGAVDVNSGATGFTQFFLRNEASYILTITSITLVGVNTGDFVLETYSVPPTVGPYSYVWFRVAFNPTSKGLKSAWVSIEHNDPITPNPFEFEVVGFGDDPNGVIIPPQVLPEGRVELDYSFQLSAAQGAQPYTWSHSGGTMPPGLNVLSDGRIAGIPTGDGGVYSFDVVVTDALGGTESRQLQVTIQPRPGFPRGDSGGGGCAAGHGAWYWLLALLVLGAICRRRKRARQ